MLQLVRSYTKTDANQEQSRPLVMLVLEAFSNKLQSLRRHVLHLVHRRSIRSKSNLVMYHPPAKLSGSASDALLAPFGPTFASLMVDDDPCLYYVASPLADLQTTSSTAASSTSSATAAPEPSTISSSPRSSRSSSPASHPPPAATATSAASTPSTAQNDAVLKDSASILIQALNDFVTLWSSCKCVLLVKEDLLISLLLFLVQHRVDQRL